MCDPVLYRCRCGRFSEDVGDIMSHVEQVHAGEFNIRSLIVLEDVLSRIVSPDPMPEYRRAFIAKGL